MKLRTITTRAAVAGATTALAAGALVATTAPAANAGTAGNVYSCNVAAQAFDATLTVSGDLPVPQYWAGAAVPENLLRVAASVDPTTAGRLVAFGASDLRVDDFAFDLAGTSVPVPLAGPITDGEWVGAGANKPFVTPDPGTASAVMPENLTVTAIIGGAPISGPCELKDGETAQTLATVDLLRQKSETTASNKTVKKGKAAVVPVTVNSTSMATPVASGKVVAKEGKKVLATGKVKKGKANLNLGKKLKVGKHKITITYLGIPSVGGSSDKITVTVKK